jgi:hypothetical protein
MGVNYTQRRMLGISVYLDYLKTIDSEAVYELQSRYNPKTGKEISKEKVLVKQEASHYEFMGEKAEDMYELCQQLEKRTGLKVDQDDDARLLYIGIPFGELTDYGRVDLLDGEVEIGWLLAEANRLKDILGVEVSIHFYSSVG